MLTEVAGEIVLPKIMASMIDSGIGAEVAGLGTGYILSRALLMIACIGIMIIGGIGGHFFAIRASVYFSADLRQGVFEKVQNFSFKNIDNFSTGSLVTRLTNDITQVQNMVRMLLIMAMRSPGMLIGGIIMAFFFYKKNLAFFYNDIGIRYSDTGDSDRVAFKNRVSAIWCNAEKT